MSEIDLSLDNRSGQNCQSTDRDVGFMIFHIVASLTSSCVEDAGQREDIVYGDAKLAQNGFWYSHITYAVYKSRISHGRIVYSYAFSNFNSLRRRCS